MKKLCLAFSLSFLFLFQTEIVDAYDVEGVSIHGYISQGYLKSDDNNYLAYTEKGTFEFTEVGFNLSKDFDKLRVGLQVLSRDLGEFGNNEIELDWALGEYHYKDFLGFRIGKIKMPLGFYNQERDVDMLRVPVFLPSSVYDEGMRNLMNTYQGVGIYGVYTPSFIGELDYEFFYGSTNVDIDSIYVRGNETEIASFIPGSTAAFNSIDVEYMTGGAIRWIPYLEGLRLGLSYYQTEADIDCTISSMLLPGGSDALTMNLEMENWVSSIEYIWNDLTIAAEYAITEMSTSGRLSALGAIPDSRTKGMGWYLLANYRLSDIFSIGAYYSEYYPDKDDKEGDLEAASGNPSYAAWQKEIVPTLRFDFSDHLVIKGEVHFIDGVAQVYDFNNPDGRKKDWYLYTLKATFSF